MNAREVLVEAYNRGYRIDKDGNAISPSGKKLSIRVDGKDYQTIGIRINRMLYSVPCHRLMAYQKFGDLMFSVDCVRHLNGNHRDNSYDNIEIGTMSDNMMDIPKEIRVKSAISATTIKHGNVLEIREYYNICNSYKKTMEKFNISSKGTLHYILNSRVILCGKQIAV